MICFYLTNQRRHCDDADVDADVDVDADDSCDNKNNYYDDDHHHRQHHHGGDKDGDETLLFDLLFSTTRREKCSSIDECCRSGIRSFLRTLLMVKAADEEIEPCWVFYY